MDQYWNLEWVIAHISEKTYAKIQQHPRTCNFMTGLYDDSNTCTSADRLEKGIENDRKFLEICCAIATDDQDAVLEAFNRFFSGVDDLNLCFGTTLLGFTTRCGTPQILHLLLTSIPQLRAEDLRTYILITAIEHPDPCAIAKVFLDKLSGCGPASTGFALDMLLKAELDADITTSTVVLT